jgi:hypothetical protein
MMMAPRTPGVLIGTGLLAERTPPPRRGDARIPFVADSGTWNIHFKQGWPATSAREQQRARAPSGKQHAILDLVRDRVVVVPPPANLRRPERIANGLCNALASSHGARIQTSHSTASTGSAIASDGMPSDTDRWRWASPLPFPMSFANSPKRTCGRHQYTVRPKMRASEATAFRFAPTASWRR